MSEATTIVAAASAPRGIWRASDLVLMALFSLGIFALGCALLAGPLVVLAVLGDLGLYRIPVLVLAVVVVVAMEAVALVVAVYCLGLRRRRLPWGALGLRRPPARWALAAAGLGVACLLVNCCAVTGIGLGLDALSARPLASEAVDDPLAWELDPTSADRSPAPPYGPESGLPGGGYEEPLRISPASPHAALRLAWLASLIALPLGGLVVPFAEELFFRGVLYAWLRGRWGVWVGSIFSALAFGLVHVAPLNVGTAFLIGLLAAVVYERSGSLWPAVILHAANNTLALTMLLATISLVGLPLSF